MLWHNNIMRKKISLGRKVISYKLKLLAQCMWSAQV